MQRKNFLKRTLNLVLMLMTILSVACSEKLNTGDTTTPPDGTATLVVSTENIELASTANASQSFIITTSTAWSVVTQGNGYTLDKTSGMGNAEISVTATAANTASSKVLGTIKISAAGVTEQKTIEVKQLGTGATPDPTPDPDPVPVTQVISIDFTKGINIAIPALPNQKAEATSGAITYTIDGYAFEVYADAALDGIFYWIDNTVFQDNTAIEPNKGLYLNKLGSYIKFPAIAGKALSEVSYTATTNQSSTVKSDLMGSNGENINYTFEGGIYTLIEPAANTAYRLEVTNSKAIQIALLKLVYIDVK